MAAMSAPPNPPAVVVFDAGYVLEIETNVNEWTFVFKNVFLTHSV